MPLTEVWEKVRASVTKLMTYQNPSFDGVHWYGSPGGPGMFPLEPSRPPMPIADQRDITIKTLQHELEDLRAEAAGLQNTLENERLIYSQRVSMLRLNLVSALEAVPEGPLTQLLVASTRLLLDISEKW